MTKPVKMFIFMLIATAFNIAITALCFLVLFLIYTVFLLRYIPAEKAFIGIPVLFIGALVLAFFVYRKAIKAFLKKHPIMEEYYRK